MHFFLQPIIITIMAYIFSFDVLGATLPNPTDVKVVKVKYMDVMYRDFIEGPPVLLAKYKLSVALARCANQPIFFDEPERSAWPIAYLKKIKKNIYIMKIQYENTKCFGYRDQNHHWKLGQQTPSFGITLVYLETTA